MAWIIGLITGRTKNAYGILVRKRLENLKGIWEEKIRVTFVGIYHGAHLLFIKQDNSAVRFDAVWSGRGRGELSYLAPLGSENISAPYFKQCFFRGGVLPPQTE